MKQRTAVSFSLQRRLNKVIGINQEERVAEENGKGKNVTAWRQRCPGRGSLERYRPSWLTNSALVYEPKCEGKWGGGEYQPMSKAAHMEPK
jgi:hypothetical protein